MQCLEEVGARLETLGHRETVRACYERGLEIEASAERCSRGLLRRRDQLE